MLAASLLSTACYRVTFVDERSEARAGHPDHEQWTDFWVLGFVGEAELDVRRYCGDRAARVTTKGNLATGVVSILTLGIYVPRKASLYCAEPASRRPALPDGETQ